MVESADMGLGDSLGQALDSWENYLLGSSVWVLCRLPEQKGRSEQIQETEIFSFCLACVERSFLSKGLDMFLCGFCHNSVLTLPGRLLGGLSYSGVTKRKLRSPATPSLSSLGQRSVAQFCLIFVLRNDP